MTLLKFSDPRDFDYFAPQTALSWSDADGQDGNPGCLALSGANNAPAVGVLPTYRFAEFDASVNSGNNTVEFYFNVRDSSQASPVRLLFYRDAGVADGQANDQATLLITINRALSSSTVRLQARNDSGAYPYVSGTLNRNQWHRVTLDFDHQGAICTADVSINGVLYLAGHVCEGNYAIGKLAIESQDAAADVLFDDITTDATALSKDSYTDLDPTKDTPYGRYYEGEDITLPLQWAASNMKPISEGGHGRNVKIPPGRWVVSDVVTTSYRSGGKLLGSGMTDPDISSDKQGVGTVLIYAGADDGHAMIKCTGTNMEIGDWTMYATGYSNAVGLAWGKPLGSSGLGTGKSEHKAMRFVGLARAIQLRQTGIDSNENVDNLLFDVIEVENCGICMHMNSTNVMDIYVAKIHCQNTGVAFFVQGGGQLHVGHALFTIGTQTCLYIPADSDVADNNGKFCFDHVKVDNQHGNTFTFCESYQQYTHQIHLGRLLLSPTLYVGTFAIISGRCILTIAESSSSFKTIQGIVADGVTPACILGQSFLERPVSEIFTGDVRYRAQDCLSWSNFWRDPDPVLVAANK